MAHNITTKPIGLVPPRPPPELYWSSKVAYASTSTSQASSTESATSVKDSKQAHKTSKSVPRTSSTEKSKSESVETSTNVMYQQESAPNPMGRQLYHRPAGLSYNAHATMPPPLQDIPPLAFYHICRVCFRPRSGRYQREHPIPINGILPPPGICRRCRVTSAEEVVPEAELVKLKESNDVKLGIRCFVPEEDYVPGKGIGTFGHPRSNDESLQTVTEGRNVHKDIRYRHVKVVEVSPSEVSKSSSEKEEKPQASAISATRQRKYKISSAVSSLRSDTPLTHMLATNEESRVTTKRRDSVTEPASVTALTRQHITIHRCDKPTEADVRRIASEEVRRSHQECMEEIGKGLTKSDVAKIARDEISRYRQAERSIEAHAHAYAYGRMNPVERRISSKPVEAVDKPWDQTCGRDYTPRQTPGLSQATDDPKIKETIIVSLNNHREADSAKRVRTIVEDGVYSKLSGPSQAVPRASEQSQREAEIQTPHSQVDRSTLRSVESTGTSWMPDNKNSSMTATDRKKYDSILHGKPKRNLNAKSDDTGRQHNSGQEQYHMRSSQFSDEDYWSDEKTTWPARSSKYSQHHGGRQQLPSHPEPGTWSGKTSARSPNQTYGAFIDSFSRPHRVSVKVDGTARHQYPSRAEIEHRPLLSMPSPRDFTVSPAPSLPAGSRDPNKSLDRDYLYAKRETERVDEFKIDRFGRRPRRDHILTTETIYREQLPSRGRAPEKREGDHDYKGSDLGRVRFSNRVEFSPTPPVSDASSSKIRDLRDSYTAPQDYPPSDLSIDAPRDRRHTVSSSGFGSHMSGQNPIPIHSRSSEHSRPSLSRANSSRQPEATRAGPRRLPMASGSTKRTSNGHPSKQPFSESPSREKAPSMPRTEGTPGGPYANPDDPLDDDLLVHYDSPPGDEEAMAKRRRSSHGGNSGWRRPV